LGIARVMLATCKSHVKFASALEQTYNNNGMQALLAELGMASAGK
jgi:hypothetical protein